MSIGSGQPFSSFGPGVAAFPPSDIVQYGIRWPRAALGERIERRVHAMMTAGLLDEVARLAAHGLSPTARQALGYKELLDHLDGLVSLDEAVGEIVTRTPTVRHTAGAVVPPRPPRTLDRHRSRRR